MNEAKMTEMKKIFLYVQGVLYILAGINHFYNPPFYLRVMPDWMPLHHTLVALSGVAEMVLGVLLINLSTRKVAAWLILVMLVLFLFLIHVPMTIDYAQRHDPNLWLTVARLPIQLVLIWWAWIYTRSE
jgi:uncharacterized membrane protein